MDDANISHDPKHWYPRGGLASIGLAVSRLSDYFNDRLGFHHCHLHRISSHVPSQSLRVYPEGASTIRPRYSGALLPRQRQHYIRHDH